MSQTNQTTIESYNLNAQNYIDGTPHKVSGSVKAWLDQAVAGLTKEAAILELGSAFGRDALYLQDLGYSVTCTDATPAFVDILQAQGLSAYQLNAIKDDFGHNLDAILANAVLLHFTAQEANQVLQKAYAALKTGGRLAITLKQGVGEEWSQEKLQAPRYFYYWTKLDIQQTLAAVGFTKINIHTDTTLGKNTWLQIIATK